MTARIFDPTSAMRDLVSTIADDDLVNAVLGEA